MSFGLALSSLTGFSNLALGKGSGALKEACNMGCSFGLSMRQNFAATHAEKKQAI
jgi:hypothetical protein